MQSYWIRLSPKFSERLEDTEETQDRRPFVGGARAWSYATTSQRMPRIAGNRQEREQGRVYSSPEPLVGARPYQHLNSDVQPSELRENTFLLCKATQSVVIY